MKKTNNSLKFKALAIGILFICVNVSLKAQFKYPSEAEIKLAMQEAHGDFQYINEGRNADYIPYLSSVDANLYGIAVATVDGKIYEIGDTKYEFGIESISKVFVLAKALQERGSKVIEEKIGVNATGFPFNSILPIELEGKKAISPLVNAGAMATNSLIKGSSKEDQFNKINAFIDQLAGRKIRVINILYQSEAATNSHNRAIAWLLSSYNGLEGDPEQALDSYTRQCSWGVTATDLAVMSATLANKGIQPITKKRVIDEQYVPKVLASMVTEGLYEKSGEWLYNVGVPAKSGVGGGVIAVIPGVMAISAFAPPLDEAGNSVKAQKAIAHIVNKLGLNMFNR
ncbi:MAG: glutaminase A [Solitalea-like symbiont of Tyrophagus putrescentiae]